MGLYASSLSNSLITCGNRIFPYSPEEARRALAQHSFGVTTEEASDLEEDNLSSLPSNALFLSAHQEDCQIAVQLAPRSLALQFQEGKHFDVPTTYAATAAHTASLRTPRATPAAPSSLTMATATVATMTPLSLVWFGSSASLSSVRFSGNYGSNIKRIFVPCYCKNSNSSSSNTQHAGFVLKSQRLTPARLVLDPSGNLNGALLKSPNLEEKISSVLCRIQNMPVLLSADICEAYFRL